MAQQLFSRMAQIRSVLRLRPFDTATEAGRSQERYRRALLGTIGIAFSKIVQSSVLLISVPMALSYLGKERYGIWMTITSLVAMWGFSDLGLSQGLMNVVAEANGKQDIKTIRRAISSTIFILLCTTLMIGFLFAVVYPHLPWVSILKAGSSRAMGEAGPAVGMFVTIFLASIPLGATGCAQFGLQEGGTTALWTALASLASLIGLMTCRHFDAALPWLVLAWSGGAIPVRLLQGIQFFGFSHRELRPVINQIDFRMARRLMKTGLLFMVISMSMAIGCTSDSIVLTQIRGPAAVTDYSILYRMFSIVTIATTTILVPLWPAYGEACSRGDISWIQRTLKRSATMSLLLTSAACAILLISGKWLLRIWVGSALHPTIPLMLPFGLYLIINGLHLPIALVLNGLTVIRFQVICCLVTAIVNLGLSIILTHLLGVPGVMWGTVIATTAFMLLPEMWYVRRVLHHRRQIHFSSSLQPVLDNPLPPEQIQTPVSA